MSSLLQQFRNLFVSLQLTVALLILSLLLVFVATLDQVNLGIWAVQAKYFQSFFVLWPIPGTDVRIPIFPGGYTIGSLLLINLLAAHVYRFSLTWKKLGIQLTHAGLIILLIGELLTGLIQKDSSMRLEEGQTKRYSESFRENELAIIDRTDPNFDTVVALPEDLLADQVITQHPKLPFQVKVPAYYPNANMQMVEPNSRSITPTATQGIGTRVQVIPLPITYKPDERNLPAAFVEIIGPSGSIGTWAVSPLVGVPQTFNFEGRTWELVLRAKRYYHPFALTLLKFSHDRYPGTQIPKNFSSSIRLKSDDGQDDREVLIYMNNPLRHGGQTFYQASFEKGDRVSILQVVNNPSWLLPYIATIMMGVGLLIQFGYHLTSFIRKRAV